MKKHALIHHPYLVPVDGSFEIKSAPTKAPAKQPGSKKTKKLLEDQIEQLSDLQRLLYAHDQYALLLIFQAMDAAGKDSTIRQVMSGIDPSGCQVFSFKQPSHLELDHDFLWRSSVRLPERGRIGIFNRSYYEETIIVRVHPQILKSQKLPSEAHSKNIWEERFESIRDHEKHLARNGTIILKFFLNISPEEQARRFLSRLEEPEKNWKFSAKDVEERKYWPKYMKAYEGALQATSKPWAPWYAIPADNKPFMRLSVAQIIVETLSDLKMTYPKFKIKDSQQLNQLKRELKKQSRESSCD